MTTEPFTPHADSIQTAWVLMCQQSRISTQPPVEELEAEFDRFLARVRRDAAREAEAERAECPDLDAHHERYISPLAVERLNELQEALDSSIYRLKKAEQERDEARRHECSDLDAHWRLDEALASLKEANATVASLHAEQPRPLTPDEMIQRVRDAARDEGLLIGSAVARRLLTAALAEPTRPEGAETLAAAIAEWDETGVVVRSLDEADADELADHLAALGYRKAEA